MNIEDIKRVLVIGAGTMGHSIAQLYAQAGFEVDLVDLNEDALKRAMKLVKLNLPILVEFGKVNDKDIHVIINRIHPSTDLAEKAPKADLVVEAISEVPDLKQKLFLQLDDLCSEDVIIASNTSGLDVFKLARNIKMKKISRLIIHHYYAPAHIIPLVEVASGRKTSEDLVELSEKLLKKLGKKPIVMKKFSPSFIVNKIQNAIGPVVFTLIGQGIATVEQIDYAIKTSLGIRLPIVGGVQTYDFTGLDLVLDVGRNLGRDNPVVAPMVERGDLGVKSGKGFYDYGGLSEEEILNKRDRQYLKMLEHLEKINAFEPI
ncbi:MAG: 3-hydroxyacyl-CoA dehydrogenase family protein [Promethearchaeota archaeon]